MRRAARDGLAAAGRRASDFAIFFARNDAGCGTGATNVSSGASRLSRLLL